jgi:hypothetical protein
MRRNRPLKPADRRAKAKRAALKALKRTRRAAEQSGTKLSDWEGEFLGSVEERVETYGRAFADPEKGSRDASLSRLQGVKLREIAAKARKKDTKPKAKSGLKRRKPLGQRHGK